MFTNRHEGLCLRDMDRITIRAASCLLVVTIFSVARADQDDAKAQFERATAQFRSGRFHEAALAYQQIYERYHDAELLYDSAQAFRLGGEPEKALPLYKSYLSAKPNAGNRDEVQGRIQDLEKSVAEQKSLAPSPDHNTPSLAAVTPMPKSNSAPQVSDRRYSGRTKIAGIALVGLALGTAGGGIVAAVFADRAFDSINRAAKAGQPFVPSAQSTAKNDTIVTGVMFGVAGASAIAGSLLIVLGVRETRAQSQVSVVPLVSRTLAGFSAGIRF